MRKIFGEQQAEEIQSQTQPESYADAAKREVENNLVYPLLDVESLPLQW